MNSTKIIFLMLLSVLIIPNAALGDRDSEQLTSLYIEWRGGTEAMEKLESVSQSGNISIAGLNGSITLSQRKDGYLYQAFDLDIYKSTEVTTPEYNWVVNASGQIEDLGGTSQQAHNRALMVTFLGMLLGNSDLDRKRLEPEMRNGKSYGVVRFTYDNGDYLDMFIDPENGAHTWTRERTDGKEIWHELSDWRMVGNIRFPFHEQSLHEQEAENSEIVWQKIDINTDLVLALYAKPEQVVDTGGIEGGSSTRWLPMQTYLNRYIFIDGMVNGHKTEIVLDSGAGMTVLDKRFADAAGIKGQGALQAQGASGNMIASMTDGITIDLDQLHLKNLTAVILDLSEVSRGLGKDIPVILGKEVFNNFIVDIDYPGKRIAFREYQGYNYEGSGSTLKLYPGDDGHKLLDISLEGLPPARVTLDTGSGLALTLFRAFWDETHHMLDDGRLVSDVLSGGVGGDSVSTITTLKSANIAGYELRNLPVELYSDSVGSFNTKRLAGNLGAGILNRFRVIFDYSQDRLMLEPSPGATMKPFDKNRVGLQLRRTQKGLSVVHVAKGSPAEKANWKKGDILTSVNNETFGKHYREQWHELSTAAAGTVLMLLKGNGVTTSIVLADYY